MKSFVFTSLLLAIFFAHNSNAERIQGIDKRILGGQIAKPHQFPYQVRLEISKFGNGQYYTAICGGSLISAGAIVTAAHCLADGNSATVILGATNLMIKEPTTRIDIPVQKTSFIIHELYNPQAVENDIALIILPGLIIFNAGVQPIRLPRGSMTQLANHMGIISGFGKLSDRLPTSNELRFANRLILPEQICHNSWPGRFKGSQMCIDGSNRISACPGDSGGPLVIVQSDGVPTLVGLTSYGNPSCEQGVPTVYTRITSFLEWIHQKTGIPIARD